MAVITFIGAGMMASALTVPAYDNKNTIRLVGTHLDNFILDTLTTDNYHITMKRRIPKSLYYKYADIEHAINGADAYVCGVSSFGVEWFAENIIPLLPDGAKVISVTKGLINNGDGTLLTVPEYFESVSGIKNISYTAIGGPCTSYELADRHHSRVWYCGKSIADADYFKDIFQTDYYHIKTTVDYRGIEVAVALKNAYALAVSLAIGMAQIKDGDNAPEHYNTEAGLFAQSVCEMRSLIKLYGGDDNAIDVGAGDLYVTVFGGRTRRIGTLLGRGMSISEALRELNGVTLESVAVAERIYTAIKELTTIGTISQNDYPLMRHIGEILNGKPAADIPWKYF